MARRHGHHDDARDVARCERPAGPGNSRDGEMVGVDVLDEHVDAGPPERQGDGCADESGSDDEDRAADERSVQLAAGPLRGSHCTRSVRSTSAPRR